MLRSLYNRHIGAYLRTFKITSTSSPSATINVGGGDGTAISRASAGKTSITPYLSLIQPGIVLASPSTDIADGGYGTYDTDPSSSAIVTEFLGASGSGDDGTGFVLALDYSNEDTDRSYPGQAVKTSAGSCRMMGFKIAAAGTIAIGGTQATVSKASSVYTITFNNAYGRDVMAWASPIATAQKSAKVTAVSASAVSVATFDSSEAAEDNAFYLLVIGWDSSDEQWGMRRTVQVPQIKPRLEAYRISGSGTAALALGSTDGTLVDNGTGDYSVTFTEAFQREPIVIVTAKAGRAQLKAAASSTAFTAVSFGATGSAADDDICVFVLGYDSAMEI